MKNKLICGALAGVAAIVSAAPADATVFTLTFYGTANITNTTSAGTATVANGVDYTAVYTVDDSKARVTKTVTATSYDGGANGAVTALVTLGDIASYAIHGDEASISSVTLFSLTGDSLYLDSLVEEKVDPRTSAGQTGQYRDISSSDLVILSKSLFDGLSLTSPRDIAIDSSMSPSGYLFINTYSVVDGVRQDDFAQYGAAVSLNRLTITSDADAPAVPEPATWAMMIGGFGLVGAAMRRRKAVASALA